MKKVISALVLFALLLTAFVACGGNTESGSTSTTASSTTTAAGTDGSTTTAPESGFVPENDTHDIPTSVRFDGEEFIIATYADGNISQYWANYLDADDPEPGNILQEAAYSRNLEVESMLGITVTGIEVWDWNTGLTAAMDIATKSAVSAYDVLAIEPTFSIEALIIDELVLDVAELPYIDLSKSYYNSTANDVFYLRDSLYLFISDICFPCQSAVQWLVNDDMMTDLGYDADYIQTKVDDGTWCVAVFEEMIEGVYSDVNADGVKDLGDIYGLGGATGALCNLYPGAGLKGTYYTDEGFEFDYGTDLSIEVYNKILEMKTGPDVYCIDWADDPWFSGNALFSTSGSEIQKLRDADFEFSVLPVPKYTDTQERYYNFATGGVCVVPCNIRDEELAGAAIEAMSWASSKHLVPAFYDNFVEQGVLRNEASCRNWDRMLSDWVFYEFCYLISPDSRLRYYEPVYELLYVNDPGFVNAWDTVKESIEETCWIFYEFYLNPLG